MRALFWDADCLFSLYPHLQSPGARDWGPRRRRRAFRSSGRAGLRGRLVSRWVRAVLPTSPANSPRAAQVTPQSPAASVGTKEGSRRRLSRSGAGQQRSGPGLIVPGAARRVRPAGRRRPAHPVPAWGRPAAVGAPSGGG